MYYIDTDDMEVQDPMGNARKKLELPLEAAVLCKTVTKHGKTCCVNSNTRKTRYACIIEVHGPRGRALERLNMEILLMRMGLIR